MRVLISVLMLVLAVFTAKSDVQLLDPTLLNHGEERMFDNTRNLRSFDKSVAEEYQPFSTGGTFDRLLDPGEEAGFDWGGYDPLPDPTNVPVGDGLLVMLTLAGGYLIHKRKENC